MHDYFISTPFDGDFYDAKKIREVTVANKKARERRVAEAETETVWRRPRRRLGLSGGKRADTTVGMMKLQCQALSVLVDKCANIL